MSSLVIVAIPADDDQVWKVSSEKVPHLTLLYLGDSSTVDNVDSIAEFLDHAASTSLDRFDLDVDRRGTLGGDQADVLFFSEGWEAKEIKRFRHFLLQNNDIRKAYDASEQHPNWTPHLTLGYPDTPAKPNPDDYGISWVRFDRVALWVGDYEGPEFTLKTNSPEVSMSDTVDDILAHYGTKGMKWGVRKADKFFGTKTIPAKPKSRKVSDIPGNAKVKLKTKNGDIVVRRDQIREVSSESAAAQRALSKAKTKGIKALSNDELKILNERLQLEKRFSDLNPTTTNKGKKILQQQLRQVGGMAVGAAASKYLIKRVF